MDATLGQFGYRQELKRSLSLLDLVIYGLLVIVPTAPMATFGIVYNQSRGMVPLVYIVGLIAMVFTALSYLMMSRAFPLAGMEQSLIHAMVHCLHGSPIKASIRAMRQST